MADLSSTNVFGNLSVSGDEKIGGTLGVGTVVNSTGDFITIASDGTLTRRTAAEVLSDIGGQASGALTSVNLGATHAATTATITNTGGSDAVINGATTTTAGLVTNAAQTWAGDKTLTSTLNFSNSGTAKRGIFGTCGDNDFWFVGGAATASNSGYLEIATGDDGQSTGAEPIYVRQYGPGNPLTGTLVRTATLLDNNGNSSFPGTVTATNFSGTLNGYATNTSSSASTIVVRDASSHIYGNYIFGAYMNMSHGAATRSSDTVFYSSTDNYIRKNNSAGMKSSLGYYTSGDSPSFNQLTLTSTGLAINISNFTNATMATASGSQGAIEIRQATANADAFMTFHVGGDYACYFGLDGGTNKLSVGGWSMGAASYAIYHEGNKPSAADIGAAASSHTHTIANITDLPTISVSASNSTLVQRHSSGYIYANYFNTTPNDVTSGVTKVCVETSNDGFIRHGTAAAIQTFLGLGSAAYSATSAFAAASHTHDQHEVTVLGNYLTVDADGKIRANNSGQRRAGMYGIYSSTLIGHIWSMGSAYQIPADGANFGNLYGLAYKHTNNTTGGTMASGHMMVWCQNGTPNCALGTNIWTSGTGYGTDFVASSDINLKENIEPLNIQDCFDQIMKLVPSSFNWKKDGKYDTGFIAQEVEKIIPERISNNGDHLSLSYAKLTTQLVGAIQALTKRIEELERNINT